uniref:Uncharacterized protein n=1 Tax=Candidatus Kentrum sp. FW TaxID=2126338 RepID=A0A450SPC7_9GAMM|nr:MAG: hypothetical protein BECKFW1821B_GA0114236_102416 [Candidatus Kentron sp. FW]
MSGNKALLVVVTRGYATRGGTNDEFIQEWGFPDSDKGYEWSNVIENVALLVIHGYREHLPGGTIKYALEDGKERSASPGEIEKEAVWLFYHSLTEGTNIHDVREIIKDTLGLPNHQTVKGGPYQSGGDVAVEGLLRALEEEKDANPICSDFITAVEKAATSRVLFANRLRRLQSCLLRLHLAVEATRLDGANATEPNVRAYLEAAGDTRKTVNKIFGEDDDDPWAGMIEYCQSGTAREAIREIRKLYQTKDPKVRSVWYDYEHDYGYYTSADWPADLDAEEIKNVRVDLARFARALDELLDVAESLPPRLPTDAKEKGS